MCEMKLQDSNQRNSDTTLLTHEEIASIMTERGYPMCRGRVWQIERRALQKIAEDPIIRQLACDFGFLSDVE